MADLTAAVEAGARAWFDAGQAARRDQGRLRADGQPWQWEDLPAIDQHAYRALALPIVTAALAAATTDGNDAAAVEELATLIQETFPTGAGGYSLVWEDCFPAARAILAAGYTREHADDDRGCPVSNLPDERRGEVVALAGEHCPVYDYRAGRFTMECEACDFMLLGIDREDAKRRFGEHVADALAPMLAGWRRKDEARALREAADRVEDECTHSTATCFCGSAGWLRDAADAIEASDG